MTTFTYNEPRSGDTYKITVLGGRFCHAVRYIGPIGQDGIFYDKLEELPDGARHDVEQKIEENK